MMKEIKHKNRKALIEKTEKLKLTTDTLKCEFVGIDGIIDEIINAVSSWYLFPHIHEKPVVVNLWGLTGVGKTALVKRLSELLDFNDRFYHFDLNGKQRGGAEIEKQLEDLSNATRNYPVIIALDEFQHARTIDEAGNEIQANTSKGNPTWQLLDSGVFDFSKYMFRHERFSDLCLDLEFMVNSGVKAANGVVVERLDFFNEVLNENEEREENKNRNTPPYFIPAEMDSTLQNAAGDLFIHRRELRKFLNTLNERESLEFVLKLEKKAGAPSRVDCSNALIFVLGNLDEAYNMAGNFNPDIDADSFHELSLKITLPDIKEALKKRFRSEQIARLGNNHIIYPAFSKKSFRQLIDLELNKLSKKILKKEGIKIAFGQNLKDLIYREGVYPTQGTRPIFTTIHRLVHSVLGRVLAAYYLHAPDAGLIKLSSNGKQLTAHFRKTASRFNEIKSLYKIQIPHTLNLENLREQKQDDKQALIAVHESGHAVACIVLTGVLPKAVYSHSASTQAAGFVQAELDYNLLAQDEIIDRLAIFLAGQAAEELVFGREKRTSGSSADLRNATDFITDMLKNEGMHNFIGTFQNPSPTTNNYLYDDTDEINQTAKILLKRGFQKAAETLKKHRKLLLKLADYLCDHPSVPQEELRRLTRKYAPDVFVENTKHKSAKHPYRFILKQLLSEPDYQNPNIQNTKIMLNKTAARRSVEVKKLKTKS